MRRIPMRSDSPMLPWPPYTYFHWERVRAHKKHKDNGGSMEQKDWDHPIWPHVVNEEVGEIARAFCEFQLGNLTEVEFKRDLKEELIQVGAMVAAWLDAIDESNS